MQNTVMTDAREFVCFVEGMLAGKDWRYLSHPDILPTGSIICEAERAEDGSIRSCRIEVIPETSTKRVECWSYCQGNGGVHHDAYACIRNPKSVPFKLPHSMRELPADFWRELKPK